MARSQGIYGGLTHEQRISGRRQRLIDTAIAIWGDEGWAAVTMRRVCAEAGLIDRYFYESFADRDALLVAAWDRIRDETISAMIAESAGPSTRHPLARLRAAIASFVSRVEADPRRWRIQFGEHAGSAALEQRRRAAIRQVTNLFVAFARPLLKPGADETALRMSTLMGLGGFLALVSAWQEGVVEVSAERVVDHATDVGADLASRFLDLTKLDDEPEPTPAAPRRARRA